MSNAMTSSRPYLVRALYEWILENACTPHIVVNALFDGVEVPQEYVKDGQIVLNISPVAVQALHIDDHTLSFNGRFGGVPRDILVPIPALLGIYARENGQGMMFEESPSSPNSPAPSDTPETQGSGKSKEAGKPQAKKPTLRIVK